jgi:hypothetical protein
MKKYISILFFAFAFLLNAQPTYDIDIYLADATNGGSAGNDGLTPLTPKLISYLTSTTFNCSSDTFVVAVKRGSINRGSISSLSVSNQTESKPFVLTAYGTGRKPMFMGTTNRRGVSGDWTLYQTNVYRRSATSPYWILLEKQDDITHWGLLQTSIANCNADYKYYYASSYLYVYATSNPTTYYDLIDENTEGIIFNTSEQSIIVDNIEFVGGQEACIRTDNAHYFTLQYCEIHHPGIGNSSDADGYGLYNLSSDTWIHHNKFWEVGSHSIWHGMYGSFINRRGLIEYNYFLNDHYCCVDIQHTGTTTTNGDSRDHIVRFNWMNADSAKQTTVGSGGSLQILGENPGGSYIWVKNVKFYGNVVIGYYDVMGRICDSIFVYNNTFINHQLNFRETANDGGGSWGTTPPIRLWFYNNICYRQTTGNVVNECFDSTNKHVNYNLYISDDASCFTYKGVAKTFVQWKALMNGDDINSTYSNDQTKVFNSFSTSGGSKNLIPKSSDFPVDAGYSLGAPYNVDIIGVSRPQGSAYDLGAYEYAVSGWTPPDTTATVTISSVSNAELGSYHIGSGVLSGADSTFHIWTVTTDSFKVTGGSFNTTMVSAVSGNTLYIPVIASNQYSTAVTNYVVVSGTTRSFTVTTKADPGGGGGTVNGGWLNGSNGKKIYDKNGKAVITR